MTRYQYACTEDKEEMPQLFRGRVEVGREGSAGEESRGRRGAGRGVYRGICGAPDGLAPGTVSELRSSPIVSRAQPPGVGIPRAGHLRELRMTDGTGEQRLNVVR